MELKSSFVELPISHKAAYLIMMIGIPIAAAVIFLVMFLIIGVKEFIILALPIIFGVVAPAVVLKELLNPEVIMIDDRRITLEKRFGKRTKIDLPKLKAVIGLVTKDRKVILMISAHPTQIISASDWYNLEEKEELISILKENKGDHPYEYREFDTKAAAMDSVAPPGRTSFSARCSTGSTSPSTLPSTTTTDRTTGSAGASLPRGSGRLR